MVGRGTNDGEAKGCVDGFIEGKEFEGDETLIVVHGDNEIITAFDGGVKNGVAGEWTVGIDAKFLGVLDCGGNDTRFFVAELAVL